MRGLFFVCLLAAATASAALAQPVAAPTELRANEGDVRARFGVRVPMRDGVKLVADVWTPVKAGTYPAILIRTPYLRTRPLPGPNMTIPDLAKYWTSKGYAFVVQDVRGRGDSEGEFDWFQNDGVDGYDTIEWMAAQPWSNGRVGMMGLSYLGAAQWLAAREDPPHLSCIAPTAAPGRWFHEVYEGGAFSAGFLSWSMRVAGNIDGGNYANLDWNWIFKQRPLATMDEAAGRVVPVYRHILEHNTYDDWWKKITLYEHDFRKIDIPTLTVAGTFDGNAPGALYYWEGVQNHAPNKGKHHLLLGPWTHPQAAFGGDGKLGDMTFSKEAVYDIKGAHLAFFEDCLKGSSPGFDFPAARVYVTGSNEWRDFAQFPPKEAETRKLFLSSRGNANSVHGDGVLTWKAPGRGERADRYAYDPSQPTPMGASWAQDNREVEKRQDVLVYTTESLKVPVEIIGPVTVRLSAASDARDTDFVARIVDVHPDGKAVTLGPRPLGVARGRFRNGFEREELLSPGEVVSYELKLFDIAHTFLPGHRIRIEVTSSAAPLVVNPNTGNPIATDTEWKTARQTIFHDAKRPSYVELPVMPTRAHLRAAAQAATPPRGAAPAAIGAADAAADGLQAYVGVYDLEGGAKFTIARSGDGLTATITGGPADQGPLALVREGPDKFHLAPAPAVKLEFVRNAGGQVEALAVQRQNGEIRRGPKTN